MMVRFGFHPCFASSPSARASSSSATWPETGSSAPLTQPSWWLPRSTHRSGSSAPRMVAITSYTGFRSQLNASCKWTLAGPGPMR